VTRHWKKNESIFQVPCSECVTNKKVFHILPVEKRLTQPFSVLPIKESDFGSNSGRK
jgi:hypothetical protein